MTNREKFEAEIRAMNDVDAINIFIGNAGKLKYFDRMCKWCIKNRLHGRQCKEGDECCDYEFLNAEVEE